MIRRTRKKKGDGKAGGGLAARRQGWAELEGDQKAPNLKLCRNGNGVKNMAFHRPGSQNHNKGGRGRG